MVKGLARWEEALSRLDLEFSIEKYMTSGLDANKSRTLGFLNAHGFNCLIDIPDFYASVIDMDVILRDGIGVAIMLKLQGKDAGLNMNGTDLIPKLLDHHKGKNIAILGTREPYLEQARKNILENHQVAIPVASNGFESEEHYLNLLQNRQVDLILLAMGMPKQEKVAKYLKENLKYPVLIVCGGAIVDFYAHRFKRAPLWVRRIGFEWLYRLCQEPVRLFRRYVFGNLLFLSRAIVFSLSYR